jgi:ATP-dependent RNA circularization protein (DNA/RNA ligase family)
VCSKNYELEKSTENTFWKLAVENDLENKLRQMERDLAIQAEIVGDKIQKNSYAIHGHKMYVFNIYDIEKHAYLPKTEMLKICKDLALPICPVIAENRNVPDTIDQILQEANGLSRINDKQEREGLVWVFDGGKPSERVSFKTISNEYLLDKKQEKRPEKNTRKKH